MLDPAASAIVLKIDRDLEDLVPEYLANRRNDIAVMAEKCDRGDFAGLRSMGHKIKGTGGGYGFAYITEIGGRIEQSAEAGDGAGVRAALQDLADYLARVRVVYE